jgi:hypothetical protein
MARELQREVRHPLPATPFEALQDITRRLTHRKAARPLPCPDLYRQRWRAWRTNRHTRLEAHVIRHLCWDADTATDARFQGEIDRHRVMLGPRALQGLVRSCHARWSDELADGPAVRAVWQRVARYEGHHPLVLRWKSALPMILGLQGPGELANAMVQALSRINVWCESWGLDELSPYVQEGVRHAVQVCRAEMERLGGSPPLTRYLLAELLPWSGWRLEDFQTEMAATILHAQASPLWQPLAHLALSDPRLGDPRQPGNEERWAGMPEVARQRVIQWLSRAEIERRY